MWRPQLVPFDMKTYSTYMHKDDSISIQQESYVCWLDVSCLFFFSALWPFSTLGWPDVSTQDFKKFYPTTVLETGYILLSLTGAALALPLSFSIVYHVYN